MDGQRLARMSVVMLFGTVWSDRLL
jgi:hypothetical protein